LIELPNSGRTGSPDISIHRHDNYGIFNALPSIWKLWNVKVEAPVVDHLRNLGEDGEEYEVMEFFGM